MKNPIETTAEPQAAVKPQPSTAGSPAPGHAVPQWLDWRGSGCVLVVDDEEAVRLVVARAVAKLGFSANVAPDGASALSIFKADPGIYTIVLLDLKIPGMESSEILENIRRLRPDIPVILMSGFGSQDALARMAGHRISGFLHKPFTLEELASRMRAVFYP
jgi:DNA-binding response OmpR family regulator